MRSAGTAPVDARFQARFATMQQRLGSPGEAGASPAADGAAARVAQVPLSREAEAAWVTFLASAGAHDPGCLQR